MAESKDKDGHKNQAQEAPQEKNQLKDLNWRQKKRREKREIFRENKKTLSTMARMHKRIKSHILRKASCHCN